MKQLTIEHLAPYLPYGLYFYKKKLHLIIRSKHPHSNECKETIIHLFNNSRKGKLRSIKQWKEYVQIITDAGKFFIDRPVYYINTLNSDRFRKEKYFEYYKPILRPLSDLTKEIEHNGERFVPIQKLLEHSCFDTDNMSMDEMLKYKDAFTDMHMMLYRDAELFLKWHFDIYGLIENNLAININTI